MREAESARSPERTLLEQLIRQRQQTFEEFAEYAEKFAREHAEPGTLSVRHLQRLVTGGRPDGRPLTVRPATARLLQRMLGFSIGELLAPPPTGNGPRLFQVAVAVVVRRDDVLAVCRRGHYDPGLTWQFPSGIVKPGRSPEAVAVQETMNETGVACAVSHRLGRRLHPMTRVLCDYVLCDYVSGDAMNADAAENAKVGWLGKPELTRFIPHAQIFEPVLDALGPLATAR